MSDVKAFPPGGYCSWYVSRTDGHVNTQIHTASCDTEPHCSHSPTESHTQPTHGDTHRSPSTVAHHNGIDPIHPGALYLRSSQKSSSASESGSPSARGDASAPGPCSSSTCGAHRKCTEHVGACLTVLCCHVKALTCAICLALAPPKCSHSDVGFISIRMHECYITRRLLSSVYILPISSVPMIATMCVLNDATSFSCIAQGM